MGKSYAQSGQMLLVVVLTMIVALTVGLSVVSRTLTDVRVSRQSDESGRAFQAAEAGIEKVLQSGGGSSSFNLFNNSSFTTTVSHPSGTSFLLNGGELVNQAIGLDVWLSDHPDFATGSITGNVTFYWSTDNQTECTNTGGVDGPKKVKSALEIIVLSGARLTPTMNKYILEANGCARIANATTHPEDGGTGGTPPGETIHFQNFKTISVTNGLIARVIPIFNSTKMAIVSTVALPQQGTIVESIGKSGETVRKVQFFTSHPQIPVEIFPYSLITQ